MHIFAFQPVKLSCSIYKNPSTVKLNWQRHKLGIVLGMFEENVQAVSRRNVRRELSAGNVWENVPGKYPRNCPGGRPGEFSNTRLQVSTCSHAS